MLEFLKVQNPKLGPQSLVGKQSVRFMKIREVLFTCNRICKGSMALGIFFERSRARTCTSQKSKGQFWRLKIDWHETPSSCSSSTLLCATHISRRIGICTSSMSSHSLCLQSTGISVKEFPLWPEQGTDRHRYPSRSSTALQLKQRRLFLMHFSFESDDAAFCGRSFGGGWRRGGEALWWARAGF